MKSQCKSRFLEYPAAATSSTLSTSFYLPSSFTFLNATHDSLAQHTADYHNALTAQTAVAQHSAVKTVFDSNYKQTTVLSISTEAPSPASWIIKNQNLTLMRYNLINLMAASERAVYRLNDAFLCMTFFTLEGSLATFFLAGIRAHRKQNLINRILHNFHTIHQGSNNSNHTTTA